MRKSLFISSLAVGLLVFFTGCSIRTESTSYYYNPAFTKEGKIIFVTQRRTADKDALGSQIASSRAEYLTTIYSSRTGESSSLLDVTDLSPAGLNYSPTAEAIGFLYELRDGAYGKLAIYALSAEAIAWVSPQIINFPQKVKAFDWSSSGDKIVYCTSNEVRVKDIFGTSDLLVTTEAGLESVSWKYGTRIAVSASSEGTRSFFIINANGTSRTAIGALLEKPQISGANTNEAFGIAGGKYVKVNLTSGVSTEIAVSFNGESPSLSPDGTLVTYSVSTEASGVYILHTATGTIETVKP